MERQQSPFPLGWWGTALGNLEDQRPYVGTYGRYEYANLPPLPALLEGDLGWLAHEPTHDRHIGEREATKNVEKIPKLLESCNCAGISLPRSFLKFIHDPQLQARIRSNTDCFLYLSPTAVQSPVGDGALVHFMADSQGCIFWYLYIPTGSSDHAVVASIDLYGPDAKEWNYGEPDPRAIVFVAESFEAFLWRFWIENEIFFSQDDGTPISKAGRQYLEQYRSSPPDSLRK